ncbi:hypothetical protein LTR37_014008 [Vermiconidia calcicola]|uniref:Uncharacterized protein n=1 Tax=Vermiconidia calcicola TaxID=1690605 RepID=A0ACC3MVY8_9PEZI|nr:hypothetical protein LTR37_014008 [Vermiconidia calcicola]
MATSTNNKDDVMSDKRCHLLSILPELRLRIYDFYFHDSKAAIAYDGEVWRKWMLPSSQLDQTNEKRGTAILQTCRQVYTEAQPVLYRNTKICIHSPNPCIQYAFSVTWKRIGSLGDCGFRQHIGVIAIDWWMFSIKDRHDIARLAAILESVGWCERSKNLRVELILEWARSASLQRCLPETMELLKRIRCQGRCVGMRKSGVGCEAEWEDLARALGANKLEGG